MSEPVTTSPNPAELAAGTDALFAEVYARLKAMAGRQLGAQPRNTLDTTALVHELYLRISANPKLTFEQPAQFFAYAARAMRHLLCDRARHRLRQRAGGDWVPVTLDGNDPRMAIDDAEEALALDEALTTLARLDSRAAQVVELRYFAGLSAEDVATNLGLSKRTVDRDWQFARAFLHDRLG
jgi:RNA polymerase sigma factor (TIGR02999 family)